MTIKDIAQMAGVSISTVSKIMNGKDDNIHPETRARVLQIAKEYNYTPYSKVKNLSSAKKFLLGVLVKDIHESEGILAGITRKAQEAGYGILLLESRGDPALEARHITVFCKNSVDGVLWEPAAPDSISAKSSLDAQEIPCFFWNGFTRSDTFTVDYSSISYELARGLLDKGHKNIVCILERNDPYRELFAEGFRKCLYDRQITCNDKLRFLYSDQDYVPDLMHRSVSGAVFFSYETAVRLYQQLLTQHYSIPLDFSMAALIRQDLSGNILPDISGIDTGASLLGSVMCQALIRRSEHLEQTRPEFKFCPPLVMNGDATIAPPPASLTRRFIVIGSINTDTTFHVEALPQAGKSVEILSSISTIGGKGANQAVGISRLGHAVSLIGELGNDSEAAFIFESLAREDINTVEIHRDPKLPTGRAYIYLQKDGESAITLLAGANKNLTSRDLEARKYLFDRADYCLISSEIPLETVIMAARIAHSQGITTILKPTTLQEMPEELYSLIDILIPNRSEAALLYPENSGNTEEAAEYFHKKGIPTVIITLGHRGCYLCTDSERRFYPAAEFTPVDTTGGADAFISGLCAYLSNGYPLDKAIRIAGYAAGFCISRQGVFPALVDKYTLESHIARHEPELLL